MTLDELIEFIKNVRVVVKFEYAYEDPVDPPPDDEVVYFIRMLAGQHCKIHPLPNIETKEIAMLRENERAQLFKWVDHNNDLWVPGISKGIKYGQIVFGAISGYVRYNADKMMVEIE